MKIRVWSTTLKVMLPQTNVDSFLTSELIDTSVFKFMEAIEYNGKEVFDQDIIKTEDGRLILVEKKIIEIPSFNEDPEEQPVNSTKKYIAWTIELSDLENGTVIGNSYANPELVEKIDRPF
jgi:hypothetical protein